MLYLGTVWAMATLIRLCLGIEVTSFVRRPLCNDDMEHWVKSMHATEELMTATACARQCLEDLQCVGFSRSPWPPSVCARHLDCLDCQTPDENCRSWNMDFVHYKMPKVCHNGGVWVEDEARCDCTKDKKGWVGETCASAPRTCYDLFLAGYGKGYIMVTKSNIPSLGPEEMGCFIRDTSGHVTVLALYYTDTKSFAFNQSWAAMEDGFVQTSASWLGLKHIQTMLDVLKEKSPKLDLSFSGPGITVHYVYTDLQLGPASSGYPLTFRGVEKEILPNDFGDLSKVPSCFQDVVNTELSAFDRDRDGNPNTNCALETGSAGWYDPTCRPVCHPFGVFYQTGTPPPFHIGASISDTTLWAGQFDSVSIRIEVL